MSHKSSKLDKTRAGKYGTQVQNKRTTKFYTRAISLFYIYTWNMYPKNTHITQLHGDNTATVVSKSSFFTDFLGLLAELFRIILIHLSQKKMNQSLTCHHFSTKLQVILHVCLLLMMYQWPPTPQQRISKQCNFSLAGFFVTG